MEDRIFYNLDSCLLSHIMLTGTFILTSSSLYRLINQVTSAAHAAILLNSTFVELLNTVYYFFNLQVMNPPSNLTK